MTLARAAPEVPGPSLVSLLTTPRESPAILPMRTLSASVSMGLRPYPPRHTKALAAF